MKYPSIILITLISIALAGTAWCGERIISKGFTPGLKRGNEVLAHVPVKGLVTEFIDIKATGLGKSLGYLLWREALTAVHDQKGAGVIYAHTPSDEKVTDMLRADYHRAAIEIAQAQKTRMVLWGMVNTIEERIYINSYLTLLPELIGDKLSLSLLVEGRRQKGFSAEISRSRYNFSLVETSRRQLFDRPIITRKSTALLSEPNRDASTIQRVEKGTTLHAIDMEGSWFNVSLPNSESAWIEIGKVDVPPKEVYANLSNVRIRSGPASAGVLRKTKLEGVFKVLDMRYVEGKGVWYQLQMGRGPGWVAAWLVDPRFSLPVVNFIAGMQRYQLENYKEAKKAFSRFIVETGEVESNVNLSTAHAMLGASILMHKRLSRSDANDGIKAIEKAIKLKPYDPAIYNLGAIAHLARNYDMPKTIKKLETALTLDNKNTRSLKILKLLSRLPTYHPFREELTIRPRDENKVDLLLLKIKYQK